MRTAQTAAEAYERYTAALSGDLLIQRSWHAEQDGRHLACGLGVIGEDVGRPADCPAQIMPRWLAQMVPWFFDEQALEDAKAWGERFYSELKRLDGQVPFSVVYDWHATCVCPMGADAATKRGRDAKPHTELRELHERALSGDRAGRDEWLSKLRNVYASTDPYVDTYARAFANAAAYTYASAYAYVTTTADVDAYVYATACAYATAATYATAYARQVAIKRLADGLVESMSRASMPCSDAASEDIA